MKKFIEKLNELKIIQKNIEFIEDLPEDIYKEYFEGKKPVEEGIGVDKHRWYETSIKVFEFEGKFLGVESITDMFSESSSVEDCFHTIRFLEMETLEAVIYREKQNEN